MTARRPTNRTKSTSRKTTGKPAKTIDLTAEDVTKRDAATPSEAENSATEDKASAKDASEEAKAAEAKVDAKEEAKPAEKPAAKAATTRRTAAKKAPASTAAASKTPASKASAAPEKKDEASTAKAEAPKAATAKTTPSVGAKKAAGQSAETSESSKKEETKAAAASTKPDDAKKEAPKAPEKPVPPAAAPVADAPTTSKGGFGSGLVGGLLGGVAIVALSYFALQQGLISLPGNNAQQAEQTAQLEGFGSELSDLKSTVADLPKVDVAPIEARIAEIEGQIAAVTQSIQSVQAATEDASAPQPTQPSETAATEPVQPVDSNSPVGLQLEALTSRLEGLKERFEGVESLNDQLLAAQAKIEQLEAAAIEQAKLIEQRASEQTAKLEAELTAAKDDILSSADRRINDVVTDLSNLGEKLGEDATALFGRVSSLEENNLSEKMQSSARTIALAGLESGVASGANYQLALTTFTDVVGENEALGVLAKYAETGAPTKAELAAGYRPVYDTVLREAEDAGAATLLDKLLLNAQSLVKVRSLSGEKKGESLTNHLGVVEFHVKNGDLVKAADEWNALPDAAKDAKAGADWVAGLNARIEVDAAMESIRSEFGAGAKANEG